MAYKAYLNNTELFFDSSVQDESFNLSYAVLDLQYGASGSFTFRIPNTNPYYESFVRLTSYVDVFRDNTRIFSGRVYSISETFNLQKEIVCEGLLSILADSIFRPITYDGTVRGLVNTIIDSHNSQVEEDKGVIPGIITIPDSSCYREYQNYETSISRLSDLVHSFGGYLSVTKDFDPSLIGVVDIGVVDEAVVDMSESGQRYFLNWIPEMTDDCDQTIELRSNLLDITQEQDSSEIFTVLIPLGAEDENGERLTIKSVNNNRDYIEASSSYITQFGYITATHIWDDVTTASALKTKAQAYMAAALIPKTTITLSAADLADAGYDIESFRPGQKIMVRSIPHGINNVLFDCQKQRLDLLQPSLNKLELGQAQEGYVQIQSRNTADAIVEKVGTKYASKTQVQNAIDLATSLITGNDGGYVVFHDSDGDGYPDEILIMDTADISTAQKIWRWNKNGLGFSSNGYNGTFGLAMTISGAIVADYITTGTLNADRIRAGILQAVTGDSYWDLVTGQMMLAGDLEIKKLNARTLIGELTLYTMDVVLGRVSTTTVNGLKTAYKGKENNSYFALVPQSVSSSGGLTGVFRWITKSSSTYGNSMSYNDQYIVDMPTSSYKFIHELYYDSMMSYRISRLSSSFGFGNFAVACFVFGLTSTGDACFSFGPGQVYSPKTSGFVSYVAEDLYLGSQKVAVVSNSSKRYKEDIQDLTDEELDPHKLLELQPKQFKYKDGVPLQYKDTAGMTIPGFIAEDVADIYPSAVIHDEGQVESWDERRIIPGMLALIQEQHQEIEDLKAQIHDLQELVQRILNAGEE